MPKHERSIALDNNDKETNLALAYAAMQNLSWNILFAGDNSLAGSTPKSWKTKGQQVICTVNENGLVITSEMIHGEAVDIAGINKKNTEKFINAFEAAKTSVNELAIENNKIALNSLREKTIKIAEQEEHDRIAMNEAMNLEGSNIYFTYAIIAINVIVFILMAINGAGIIEANSLIHFRWGSNFAPLTLSGDWWRLFTNIFIHFGIIHLLMNMYCLYTVGIFLEPMLGKARYITAYLCSGILASLTSLWWHKEAVNSAGASGAIFGVYGLFLALLTSSLIPKAARQALLQSIGIFIVYNLVYGMKKGVDNSAHIGGLVSGFIIGYLYVFGIKKEKQQEQKLKWIIPVTVLFTVGAAFGYLEKNKVPASDRASVLNEIKEAAYKDNDKFNDALTRFDEIDKTIVDIMNTSSTNEMLVEKLNATAIPQLNEAERLINNTTKLDISPASHIKAKKLLEIINLRRDEVDIIKQVTIKNTDELIQQLNDIRKKEGVVFEEISKQ